MRVSRTIFLSSGVVRSLRGLTGSSISVSFQFCCLRRGPSDACSRYFNRLPSLRRKRDAVSAVFLWSPCVLVIPITICSSSTRAGK